MFFEFDLPTPANTDRKTPVTKPLKLAAGIVHYVAIRFPPGCAGKVHVQINQVGQPLWPKDLNENIKGSDETVSFNEVFKLEEGRTELTAVTWNTSTQHSHTPIIRMGHLQPDQIFPEVELGDLIRMLFKWFRRRT